MIIFLYGPDTFRAHRWLQDMKKKFQLDVDPDANSLSWIDGQTATLKEISEQVGTGSLFVKKRLIIVENIFKNKKEKIFTELMGYLKKFIRQDDNILIFKDEELEAKTSILKSEAKKLFTFLSQQKYSQEFKTLSSAQTLSWLKKESANYQKEISAAAATLLLNLSGGDLWLLAQEIKKLAFYSAGPLIGEAEVRELSAPTYNEDIFALTDALSAKNKIQAMRLLEEQYAAGLSDEYLLAMLIRQFKILLQIRVALEANWKQTEIPAKLKLHPYVAKKGALQAKNFSASDLKKYLDQLIKLDFSNKKGGANIKTELTLLISGL